jgi:hypothetical protein
MIRCTSKGCRKAVSRGKTAGTPHEQAWRWTWMFGWRCPSHLPDAPHAEGEEAVGDAPLEG